MAMLRRPAVAGSFYPGEAEGLRSEIERYLGAARAASGPVPKAIIAPHAGYMYSGPVAGTVYARLAPARGTISRVVLLGPCHRVPVTGLAATGADFFATPLGNVPIDREAIQSILDLEQVSVFEATHMQEHSLEVHLPFLQVVLGDFNLVPLVVGQASPAAVAEVLERLWGGPETLIVISTDLSHYLGYDEAKRVDAETCKAIEALDPAGLGRESACGRVPVGGMLELARRRGLVVTTLDVRNSGDTAGPRDRVVGYGAWMFTEGTRPAPALDEDAFGREAKALLDRHAETLVRLAAASIEHGLRDGTPLRAHKGDFANELGEAGACFVTLKRGGQLRGCIGSLQGYRPLVEDVAENGYSAAFKDPRFKPLAPSELEGLEMSISVLSKSVPISFRDEADLLAQLRPGIDGLIIADAGRRALFLPSVWEQLPEPRQFLGHLKAKAGLSPGHWSKGFKAWRFVTAEVSADEVLADPKSLWTMAGGG